MRFFIFLIYFSLSGVWGWSQNLGQDFERVAPKNLPEPEKKPAEPAEQDLKTGEEMATDQDELLVEELHGLVFVALPDQIKSDGVEVGGAIRTNGIKKLETPEFSKVIAPFLGKKVTLKSLGDLKKAVILYFRGLDYPVVTVTIPEQDITNGFVQVVVTESKVGEIRVEGNLWFSAGRLRNGIRAEKGEAIRGRTMKQDLAWANSNPFRDVNAVYEKGSEPGTTDVVLKVKDRFPMRFYTGYEDSGNNLTGDERWLLGFNWGNVGGWDHQMSYQYATSSDLKMSQAHSGTYTIPLPWRHTLLFFGSYAKTVSFDLDGSPGLVIRGETWQVGSRYRIPLENIGQYSHSVSVGADFKQSISDTRTQGTLTTNSQTDINQWALDYQGSLRDRFGYTSGGVSYFYSPGAWSDNNKDQEFVKTRPLSDAEYHYFQYSLQRLTKLPANFTWSVRGLYQMSDGNLQGSERLGLGGYSTVRGYDEREANGDEGFLVSTEIRTPPLPILSWFGSSVKDQFQVLWFADYGGVENREFVASEPNRHVNLLGVGPGFRYLISPYLSVRFDYGMQMIDTTSNRRNNSRMHLGVILSY